MSFCTVWYRVRVSESLRHAKGVMINIPLDLIQFRLLPFVFEYFNLIIRKCFSFLIIQKSNNMGFNKNSFYRIQNSKTLKLRLQLTATLLKEHLYKK